MFKLNVSSDGVIEKGIVFGALPSIYSNAIDANSFRSYSYYEKISMTSMSRSNE